MPTSAQTRNNLRHRIACLYPDAEPEKILDRLLAVIAFFKRPVAQPPSALWDQTTSVLITYADNVTAWGETPLQTLKRFLDGAVRDAISTVHLLPFYPSTSDDGFSVSDYRTVDPELGTWDDVTAIGEHFGLMFDLVLNHCSASHRWFRDYLSGEEYARNFFIEADPNADHSAVLRPRNLPLLTEFQTAHGSKHLWTTFSADQIDLNYANPTVLIEMVATLLDYVGRGARIVRLDAPTYLWKAPGTRCASLPQTHAVVKLFRDVVDAACPGVIVLSETNVPHAENISYFGGGDEAHLIYNFALPPLVLHAFHKETGRHLTQWAASIGATQPGTNYLNFTASHDGIGVRGLAGLVPDAEVQALCDHVLRQGGRISHKLNSDGSESPYEMNNTYLDALGTTRDQVDEEQVARFLSSQLIALALRGIPALHFQSLVAGTNDYEGLARTGRSRSINRRKWTPDALKDHLRRPFAARIFDELRRFLRLRGAEPCFHPDAAQEILDAGDALFALRRSTTDEEVFCVTNLTRKPQSADFLPPGHDLLSGRERNGAIEIPPGTTVWLKRI